MNKWKAMVAANRQLEKEGRKPLSPSERLVYVLLFDTEEPVGVQYGSDHTGFPESTLLYVFNSLTERGLVSSLVDTNSVRDRRWQLKQQEGYALSAQMDALLDVGAFNK